MTAPDDPRVQSAERAFVLTRTFDAPRELVWKAFTEPERLLRWWGPKGFTMRVARLDLHPGGLFHYGMAGPDGQEMWGKFVYREIVAPERLVFITSFSNENGGFTRHPFSPTWPLEVLSTVLFAESQGKTTITTRAVPINATDAERGTFDEGFKSMEGGFKSTWDQLDAYLAQVQAARTITIVKDLEAPRALVFQALVEAEHLLQWHHATDGWTTPFAESDPRQCGAFRIGFQSPDGAEGFTFEGTYTAVMEPERVAYTIADGRPATYVLEEAGRGRTRLDLLLTLEDENSEELQRQGWSGMLDNLATHLTEVQKPVDAPQDRTLVMTRIFNAPREMVFRAYTDPAQVSKWWGPDGFRTTTHAIDIRPGGQWRFTMHGPDGTDYPNRILYREIASPERLVFDHDSDADNDPHRFHVTITFEALSANRTRVTQQSVFLSLQDRQFVVGFGAIELGYQTLGRLAEHLRASGLATTFPSDRTVRMARTFDAPRALVWRVFTTPDLIARWWGPHSVTTTVEKLDFRPGGAWRFVHRDKDGRVDAFRGEYREIVPLSGITQTFEWEGLPGHIVVETVTFEERDGKTTVTTLSTFDTKEDRDGMVQAGMEWGARESYERMETILAGIERPRAAEGALVITRIFDAPRALVWKAFTDPEHMKRWWGPKDYTCPVAQIDLRVGGKYLNAMRSPEGQDYWSTGVYREIVPMERLVMTDSFADAQGNVVPATEYGFDADFPRELLVTVTFEDMGGKTKMTLRHEGMPSGLHGDYAWLGWNESLDKLAGIVEKS